MIEKIFLNQQSTIQGLMWCLYGICSDIEIFKIRWFTLNTHPRRGMRFIEICF